MRFVGLLLVLVVVLGAAGGGYWYWTTTPEYSIKQVRDAVKSHDLPKFREYFDVDTVSDRMVEDFLSQPMQQFAPQGGLLSGIVNGIIGLLRPTLAPVVKEEIEHFVADGTFSRADTTVAPADSVSGAPEAPAPQPSGRPTLTNFDKRFGFRKHAFRSVKYCKVEGDLATVGLLFHNEVYDTDLLLEVQMRKVENHWQIVQLTNFPDFVGRIARLQMDRPVPATAPGP